MSAKDKRIKKRIFGVLIIFTGVFIALVVRFAYIQMVNSEEYKIKVNKQASKTQIITPARGKIYDRNNITLAEDIPAYTISADATQVKKLDLSSEQLSEKISELLQCDKTSIREKLEHQASYVLIKRDVDTENANALKKWISDEKISGIFIEPDTKRYYPNRNLASHVIGFTGTDNQGLSGVELSMEKYLKGVPGRTSYFGDIYNNILPLKEQNVVDKQDGLNIKLTIDSNIQYITENALQNTIKKFNVLNGSSAIVMDPRNGEILALVSKPDFDLNNPYAYTNDINVKSTDWDNLSSDEKVKTLQEKLWRNNTVNITYEPGSTFKVITAAAGLEEGIIVPDSIVNDEPVSVSGWDIMCSHIPNHGKELFKYGMYNSCNPVFTRLSQSLGIEKFYYYLRNFGIYTKTGIDLSGEASSIIQKNPTTIDMSIASFGQGLQITPIQLISDYAAIANGGKLLKPQLIKEFTDSQGNLVKKTEPDVVRNVLSKQTASTIKDMLEGVVLEGTGVNAYIPGYRVAGKTGTAQTFAEGKRSDQRYIASFAAFAPADDPVICVLVVCDYPSIISHSGGDVAAPVVREIIEESMRYLNVEAHYTDEDNKRISQPVKKEQIGILN